ncbi:hypothetical protein MRB53_040650 [Persea americana]|nr:hypothetical protein MRB53_040650 [Persea americana]
MSFPSFCEFWRLAHEIAAVYYAASGPIHEHVPLAFAQTMFQRLTKWMETLPPELARAERMAHNVVEMQALTASYHTCFGSSAESRTISWIHGPLYVATAIIYHEREESQRMSFLACMEAFKSLLESHAVVEVFVKGLYGMAVGCGILSAGQAQRHMRSICAIRDKTLLARPLKSSVIIDQELAMKDPAYATGDDLAVKYEEVVMFDGYVDLDHSE